MEPSIWRRLNLHRDHRWAGPRISRYVDRDLPDRQQRRLAAHEELCPDCGRVISTLRTMLHRLRGLEPSEPPPSGELTAERVLARIRAEGGPAAGA